LIAMSETPNRIPAAAPSMNPWCSWGAPIRGPAISSVPNTIRPASNAIALDAEKCDWAPWEPGSVTPSSIKPPAVSARPAHWRPPTVTPSVRSAMIASRTTPPASTTWTVESGAIDIAAT
jgi:hypothetical protein